MAQGDTLEVTAGDEIEIQFQLSYKKAEIQKRKDADKLTHVTIEFAPEITDPTLTGQIRIVPISADTTSDGTRFEILPITQDDPTFTRLYRIGFIEPLEPGLAAPSSMVVRASAHLCPETGAANNEPMPLPNNAELGKLKVHQPAAPPVK